VTVLRRYTHLLAEQLSREEVFAPSTAAGQWSPAKDSIIEPAKWALLRVPRVSDVRGNLTFIEGERHIPFQIARAYYMYDVPSGSVRAGHAHLKLHQLLLALSGSFAVHLDDGKRREKIFLNRPNIGLYVPPGVWRVIDDFSGGAVMLALASDVYDESDYIRSYDQFAEYIEAH
jgi:dTDP-4-dehydrorhamnose 3,5-epimerase-like enzyme